MVPKPLSRPPLPVGALGRASSVMHGRADLRSLLLPVTNNPTIQQSHNPTIPPTIPSRPDRVLGVRFLFPVLMMRDVELTSGTQTSSAALEQVKGIFLAMNKTPFYKQPGAGNFLVLTEQRIAESRAAHLADRRRRRAQQQQVQQVASIGGRTAGSGVGGGARAAGAGAAGEGLLVGSSNSSSNGSSSSGSNAAQEDAEVAAAGGGADHELGNGAAKTCCICTTGPKDTLLTPCGHISTCFSCANILLKQQHKCPICRGHIDQVFKAFVS